MIGRGSEMYMIFPFKFKCLARRVTQEVIESKVQFRIHTCLSKKLWIKGRSVGVNLIAVVLAQVFLVGRLKLDVPLLKKSEDLGAARRGGAWQGHVHVRTSLWWPSSWTASCWSEWKLVLRLPQKVAHLCCTKQENTQTKLVEQVRVRTNKC